MINHSSLIVIAPLKIESVAFSPSELYLGYCTGKQVCVYNLVMREILYTIEIHGMFKYLKSLAFSPDGKYIAYAGNQETIIVCDAETSEVVYECKCHRNNWVNRRINSLVFTQSGNYLVSGETDGSLKMWSMADGSLFYSFQEHNKEVLCVQVSKDGRYLSSCGKDSHLIIRRQAIEQP